MSEREYKVLHLFAGIGGGSLGFSQAQAGFRGVNGRFRTIGAVDIDPAACRDYEKLTGSKATCADIKTMTRDELRAACGGESPDAIFTSPPCTGFSGLLGEAKSKSPKYQALNELVCEGLFLAMEAFHDSPPALILLENVPRIQQRGAELLDRVERLLASYGYISRRTTHDCGEIGGMGQHRPRFLLVARHPKRVPPFLYTPPKQKLLTIGDVLGVLPLPEDPRGGPMHKLPKLQWKTWLRLALIRAGGDWRDLPGMKGKPDYKTYGVVPWNATMGPITAKAGPGSGPFSVADPRLSLGEHDGKMRVEDWTKPTHTITGSDRVGSGAPSVADPRWGGYGVRSFDDQFPTVTGARAPGQGDFSVADPRAWYRGALGVQSFDEPAGVVTGGGRPGQGAFSVADPRTPRFNNVMRVVRFDETSVAVTGGATPTSGGVNVADPRLGCTPRNGSYGVQSWDEASAAVIASMKHDNAPASVADPRALLAALLLDTTAPDPPPLIIAEDGTWHRPVTTFELGALQTLPVFDGAGNPLVLDGHSQSDWRMRIGNMVPPAAARAIAKAMLRSLLRADAGEGWKLSDGGDVWVRWEDDQASAARESA